MLLMFMSVTASAARGQTSYTMRDGLWFSATLGWGSMSSETFEGRESGLSAGLATGWTFDGRLLLGVAANGVRAGYDRTGTGCLFPLGCGKTRSSGTNALILLGPIVRIYPVATGGLFLQGGGGFGVVSVDDPDVFFGSLGEYGLGAVVGVGYDIRAGTGSVAVTPVVRSVWITASELSASFLQVGLGLTFF